MSTPGSVTTPLEAGHAYEVTVSKADVGLVDPTSTNDQNLAWMVIDSMIDGGVDSDGSKPVASAVGSDMADGGDTWVATVTPRVTTSIGGATDDFTQVSYDVVDVSGQAPVAPTPSASGSSIFAKAWAMVKAHPVLSIAAVVASVVLIRPHRMNPRERRLRRALRI